MSAEQRVDTVLGELCDLRRVLPATCLGNLNAAIAALQGVRGQLLAWRWSSDHEHDTVDLRSKAQPLAEDQPLFTRAELERVDL